MKILLILSLLFTFVACNEEEDTFFKKNLTDAKDDTAKATNEQDESFTDNVEDDPDNPGDDDDPGDDPDNPGDDDDDDDEIDIICTEGKKLNLWVDANDNGIIDQGDIDKGSVVAFQNGGFNAKTNYNYYSYSAHPQIGPVPANYEAHAFFYEEMDGSIAFNFYYNVDAGGSANNIVNWDLETSGNNLADKVILSDDGRELKEVSKSLITGIKKYQGRFHYWYNTDGGIIGPFYGNEYTIRIRAIQSGDNVKATFYSAGGGHISLGENDNISSFIISYKGYNVCAPVVEPDEPVVEPDEPIVIDPVCSEGKKLNVWVDNNSNGIIDAGDVDKGSIVAYANKDGRSAKKNYNYYSVSAHPIVGPTPAGFQAHVFFYEEVDHGLAFNFYYNVDNGGSANNRVNWNIVTSGNGKLDSVILSDDRGELREIPGWTKNHKGKKKYHGRFHYWYNTDGGVIGPFHGEDYTIWVKNIKSGDNISAAFYSSGGGIISLGEDKNISSFIISYKGYNICH